MTASRIYTEADGAGGEENGTDRAERRKSISREGPSGGDERRREETRGEE